MEENKNNKSLIVLIVILLICVLGLGAFIVYDKILNNNNNIDNKDDKPPVQYSNPSVDDTKPPVQHIVTKIIESELPNNYLENIFYWNYQENYDYFFNFDLNSKQINDITAFPFIKIENNKLMWNINNKWNEDNIIKNDIKYINYIYDPHRSGETYFFLLTSKSELYTIDFSKLMQENVIFLSKTTTLTDEQYAHCIYDYFDTKINIDKIQLKSHRNNCDGVDMFHLKSDNKIYVKVRGINRVIELHDYIGNSLLGESIGCTIAKKLKIDVYGKTVNVFDDKGNKINVKHYIAFENNKDYNNHNIIIDNNNKLYAFHDNNIKENVGFKALDTVVDFKYNKGDVIIKLASGKTLNY